MHFNKQEAVILINQMKITGNEFIKIIRDILNNKNKMKQLGDKIYQVINWRAEKKIADLILKIVDKNL